MSLRQEGEVPSVASGQSRIEREARTVEAMIRLYCRDQHGRRDALCNACAELTDYARLRLDRCPFQELKPTCARCTVHCYRPEMREQIRVVMRYAGPRMLFRHPRVTLLHLMDRMVRRPPRPERPDDER